MKVMRVLTRDGQEPYLKVKVDKPRNEHTEEDGTFTTYDITLETNYLAFTLCRSHVRRRYSEFTWLRKTLGPNHSHISIPSLPRKTYFTSKLSPEVIHSREVQLQQFLKKLLSETEFLADTSVHLFLQTPLNIAEMTQCLEGHAGRQICDIIQMCDQLYRVSHTEDSDPVQIKDIPCSSTSETKSPSHSLHSDPLEMPHASPLHIPPSTERDAFSPTRPSSGPVVYFTIGTASSEQDAPIQGDQQPRAPSRLTSIEEDKKGTNETFGDDTNQDSDRGVSQGSEKEQPGGLSQNIYTGYDKALNNTEGCNNEGHCNSEQIDKTQTYIHTKLENDQVSEEHLTVHTETKSIIETEAQNIQIINTEEQKDVMGVESKDAAFRYARCVSVDREEEFIHEEIPVKKPTCTYKVDQL